MNHSNSNYLARYGSSFYYISFDSKKHRLQLNPMTNTSRVSFISIADFKLFVISGVNQLVLKFFEKNLLSLYFTEGFDREKFYREIYPDWAPFPSNEMKIRIIDRLMVERPQFENYLYLYSKRRISRLRMFYYHQLYDYLNDPRRISSVFYDSQSYLIEKVFHMLFNSFGLRITPHTQAQAKAIKTTAVEKALMPLEEQMIDLNDFSIRDYEGNIIEEDIRLKHRTKISKSIYAYVNHPILGVSKTQENFLRSLSKQKILFPRIVIIFNIITNHFFSQELSSLEIDEAGNIVLGSKENPRERTTFNFKDITSMETTSKKNDIVLNLTHNRRIPLEFTQLFYKYLFKSIAYTHMLASLSKEHYKNKLQINFMCITWNLAGIDVPSDLGSVFNESKFSNVDFLTIGVQECSVFKTKNWQKHLKILLEYYDYECVESVKMCQMFLMVFVKKDLSKFIEQVEVISKPMGFAKVIGNKGGMVIAFQFMGYQFVVINCHYSPKPYKLLDRNEMVRNSIQSFRIGSKCADFDVLADYTIWEGDLNYRIGYTWQETIELLEKEKMNELYEKDQLIIQRNTNKVFALYKEPRITFMPTYRRIKRKEEFDLSLNDISIASNGSNTISHSYSNKLGQSPSWCDRILIKSNREIDYISYTALDNIRHSDHYPVEAHFNIYLTIPSINNEKLNKGTNGLFTFQQLSLSYHFGELFEQLNALITYPFSVMVKLSHPLAEKDQETNRVRVASEKDCKEIAFHNVSSEIMPQFIFDFPHGRAINFFFAITLLFEKIAPLEIGYCKFCLEDIESKGLDILNANCKLDVSYLTKRMGTLSFTYSYTN